MTLRLRTLLVIMAASFSSAAIACPMADDGPSRVLAPKRVVVQLCAPGMDTGAGCRAAERLGQATAFGVKTGLDATITGVKFAASQLTSAPGHVRQTVGTTGEMVRGAYQETAHVTESALSVILSLTTTFLRIVSSSFSALASAIWPF